MSNPYQSASETCALCEYRRPTPGSLYCSMCLAVRLEPLCGDCQRGVIRAQPCADCAEVRARGRLS